ncbi:MAG TPA: AraC family transcriptional regulator [Gemmatimonadaceae bacterium]|nr:AraC family transcriptional regulator [Gemmatimonadaceae bacterium]
MGKIAADLGAALDTRARFGGSARTSGRVLASGEGWEVADVICTAGPHDRAFEEAHTQVAVAIVVAGSFQYRTGGGTHVMTPGSFFLGNPGECYECGHEHAPGDRCVAFRFSPAFFDGLAADAGIARPVFGAPRVPPTRDASDLVARIATALAVEGELSWEEAAIDAGTIALRASRGARPRSRAPAAPSRDVLARVTDVVRDVERDPAAGRGLRAHAERADMSAFQFLRAFRHLTGTTPHQFLLRARLRESAASLRASDRKIAEIALESGFNDLSNFNHAFRAEFGLTPRAYRARHESR